MAVAVPESDDGAVGHCGRAKRKNKHQVDLATSLGASNAMSQNATIAESKNVGRT